MAKVFWMGVLLTTLVASPACGDGDNGPQRSTSAGATQTVGATTRPSATELTAAPSESAGATIVAGIPTLRILEPRNGETLSLPAEIRYEITGFDVGGEAGGHLHIFVAGVVDDYIVEVPLDDESGAASLANDRLITGARDLTFQLATADHTPLTNPEATVTIRNLLITGNR